MKTILQRLPRREKQLHAVTKLSGPGAETLAQKHLRTPSRTLPARSAPAGLTGVGRQDPSTGSPPLPISHTGKLRL